MRFTVLRRDGSAIDVVPSLDDAYKYGRPVDDILVRPLSVYTYVTRTGILFFGHELLPSIDQSDVSLAALNRCARKSPHGAVEEARRVYRERRTLESNVTSIKTDLRRQLFTPYHDKWESYDAAREVQYGLYLLEFNKLNRYYIGRTSHGIRQRIEQHFRPDTVSVWWEFLVTPHDVSAIYILPTHPTAVKFLEEDAIARLHPAVLFNTRPGGRYDSSGLSIRKHEYTRDAYKFPNNDIPKHML